jgi:hypothetical protein
VTAVIEVLLVTLTPLAAAPPMLTVATATKFVPVIEIEVPPVVVPVLGDTEAMAGAGPAAPAVVKLQIGPAAVTFATVLLTMRQ